MHPINISDEQFDSVTADSTPVLVDFWAPWCGPCRQIAPVLDELAKEYDGRAKVVKINIDEHNATAAKFGVRGIPTLMVFKNGEHLDTMVGGVPKSELVKVLDKHL